MLEDASGWRLTFLVESVAMRDIIRSFGVKYNHNGARSWAAAEVIGQSRRDEHGEDTTFNVGFNPDLGSRLPLFPPNTTLDDGVSETIIRCVQLLNAHTSRSSLHTQPIDGCSN